MDQIVPKMEQKGLKIVCFLPKISFFAEILFTEHTPSEEMILNEVRLGGSSTINFALAKNMAGGIRIWKIEILLFL